MKLTQPMYEKRMNYLIISFRGVAELTVVVRYAHPIMVFDQKLLRKSSVINLIKVNGWVRGWMAQALCRLSSRLFFFIPAPGRKIWNWNPVWRPLVIDPSPLPTPKSQMDQIDDKLAPPHMQTLPSILFAKLYYTRMNGPRQVSLLTAIFIHENTQ
jgi:hypothetical protein